MREKAASSASPRAPGSSAAVPASAPSAAPSPEAPPQGADEAAPPKASLPFRLAGGAVHLYTASGSVLALLIVVAALQGDAVTALWLGLVTLIIDGTDGMLARRFRVKETIPWFDGARLDDIVDYLTYVFAPVVLLWTSGSLPAGPLGWVLAAMPLLASSYQFCRVDAKTSDHFFLGFPSYWNVVAFYILVIDVGPSVAATVLVVFSILVFVPVRYIYPSRTKALRRLNLALAGIWLATYALLLLQFPDPHPALIAVSLGYIAYYMGASAYLTVVGAARRRGGRGDRLLPAAPTS